MSRLPLFLSVVLMCACSTSSENVVSPAPAIRAEMLAGDVLPVIDTHTHTVFSGESGGIPDTAERYFQEMREAGVVGAVSHVGRTKDFQRGLKSKHVVQCYGVGVVIDRKEIENGLRKGDYGCVKIYLGYVYRYAADPLYRPIYRLAEKYDVPVVFHTGDTFAKAGKIKYADPLTIDEVAVDFPKVTFVIAHLGNPWVRSAAEVAYKNDNVYVEASALLIGDLQRLPAETVDRYLTQQISWAFGYIENPSKFLYGTDWPLTGMKDYLEAYKRAIPREHWCDVFFRNAVKVFRMKELAGLECRITPGGTRSAAADSVAPR